MCVSHEQSNSSKSKVQNNVCEIKKIVNENKRTASKKLTVRVMKKSLEMGCQQY